MAQTQRRDCNMHLFVYKEFHLLCLVWFISNPFPEVELNSDCSPDKNRIMVSFRSVNRNPITRKANTAILDWMSNVSSCWMPSNVIKEPVKVTAVWRKKKDEKQEKVNPSTHSYDKGVKMRPPKHVMQNEAGRVSATEKEKSTANMCHVIYTCDTQD